jgi:hypothetical protein
LSWVKIDDRYATHRKILRAGPTAMALDVAGMCYAAVHETDGHIPSAALAAAAPFLSKPKALAAAATLVEVGRWSKVSDGWQIHDFLEYNPSAAQRQQARDTSTERVRAHRDRKRRNADVTRYDETVKRTRNTTPGPIPDPPKAGMGPPKSPPSQPPPSGPASPEPSHGADSAGQTHPRPALAAVPPDPGDPPNTQVNGQVPALSAALMAQVSAELDATLGPAWRRKVPAETSESREEFEARRAQELARFEAKFEQELNENRLETEPESIQVEPEGRADE